MPSTTDLTPYNVANEYKTSSPTHKRAELEWIEPLDEHWEVIALQVNLRAKEEERQVCPQCPNGDHQKSKLECQMMRMTGSKEPLKQSRQQSTGRMPNGSALNDFEQWHREVHFYPQQQFQDNQLKQFVVAKHERFGNVVNQTSRISSDVDS